MDSQCAGMHSRSKMMQGGNAKDAKDCTEKCVHQFDSQEKAAGFVGQKVSVKGTYDSGSKTIHVESVEAR